jgi:hypothetical protein
MTPGQTKIRAGSRSVACFSGPHAFAAILVVCAGFLAAASLPAQNAAGPLAPRANSAADRGSVPAAQPAAPASESTAAPTAGSEKTAEAKSGDTFVVPSGTRLPLVLHNSITTRNAQPGDPLYFETVFPVVLNDRILVPAGSYVQGEVLEATRPGRVKGRGEIRIRLTTMILPNGYTVKFDAVPTNAGTGGNESTDKEGKINGDSDKGTDAGTVLKTTAAGAGIGAVAGRSAGGAGIGAAAGAAAGIATVMLTRGPELELPRGSSLDIVLDRAVYLDASKINFTDPGHASTLPGPASREPTRSRSPF